MSATEDQARYPFLKEASSFVERFSLGLKELADYPGVVSRAMEWASCGLEGQIFITDPKDPETDILAYPLALTLSTPSSDTLQVQINLWECTKSRPQKCEVQSK